MKITIKTLQQKVFHIDADSEDTIGKLKEKILEAQGHSLESQRLIYSGRVLPDSKTVASCDIKEKDFLVLMVAKPRLPNPSPPPSLLSTLAASSSAPPAVAPQPPAVPEAALAPLPAALAPVPVPVPAAAPAPAPTSTPQVAQSSASDFVTGSALESTIQNMIEMGFERDQVVRSLRASYNNPDRAVEYLFNGIPAHLEHVGQPSQPAPPPAAAPAPGTPTPGTGAPAAPAPAPAPGQPQNLFQLAQQQQQQQQRQGGGGLGADAGLGAIPDLSALPSNGQIAQLRQLVAQNPGLIQPLIQQLAAANPQLGQMLAENPQALLNILEGGEGGDVEGGLPGVQVVNITADEQAAIERLEALGFPRQAVIEAYFACDKNEELAANYLFDMPGEE